jgi:hypothetical protein
MWVQYLPQQFFTHFIYNSYSVCFYYKKWWLSELIAVEKRLQSEHTLSYHQIQTK